MSSIYPSSNSTSSTSSANLMRISGMASGIDTDALVKSMVSNYQSRIDKANGAKQTLEWKQEGYREIIKGIKGLQDYFDPLSSKYMMSGNSFNTNSVNNFDTAIVSATVSSSAKTGTYDVNVQQLAEQAKIEGKIQNSMIGVSDSATWTGKTLKVDVGGVKVNLDNLDGSNTVNLVADINSKIATSTLNGKITASYVKEGLNEYIKFTKATSNTDTINLFTADNATIADITDTTINGGVSPTSQLVSDLGFTAGTISFTVTNGTTDYPVSLTLDNTTTVQDLMDEVNSATGGATRMDIDDTTGKISFQSKGYGSVSSIKITDATDTIITKLGLPGAVAGVITGTGIDAIVDVTAPGESKVTTSQSSNEFTADGVTYDLVSKGSSSVTVTSNSDTVVSNVKKFIEDYNTIISTINTKLTEKKDRDYAPLTDDQRTSMSDDQIKTWEAKAKVGILRKDDYLNNLKTQLRGTLYSPVYSSYNSSDTSTGKISLSFGSFGTGAVGIDISTDYSDGGKLVIKDETKLKNAIENNMDDFKKLFIGASSSTLDSSTSYIGSEKYNEDGIFKRMDNIIREYVASPGVGKDGTYSLSGYMNIFINKQYDFSSSGSSGKNTVPDQMYNKTLNVSKFQAQLERAQTRYYAKFTALETAMNALNTQQSALSSMLGTGA
jgi:flagellar hook-associated protein 2